jgi:hypothetical protein
MFTDIHVSQATYWYGTSTNITQTRTTYTCGEDGHIRAWKLEEEESMDVDEEEEPAAKKSKDKDRKDKRKEKKEKRRGDEKEKARYKPYWAQAPMMQHLYCGVVGRHVR